MPGTNGHKCFTYFHKYNIKAFQTYIVVCIYSFFIIISSNDVLLVMDRASKPNDLATTAGNQSYAKVHKPFSHTV